MTLKLTATLILTALTILADPTPAIVGVADAAAIRSTVTAFQNALGPLNAPGAGGNANGRREINWDIVPAAQAAPNNLPPDFFNKNSVRGVVLALDTPGLTAFQVSGNEGEAPIRFDNLLPGNWPRKIEGVT